MKNKVAPPFRQAVFDIIYGEGISREGELIDYGVEAKIIDQSGSWFAFGSEKLGQGRENVRRLLKENPEICTAIETKVREFLGVHPAQLLKSGDMQHADDEPESLEAGLQNHEDL